MSTRWIEPDPASTTLSPYIVKGLARDDTLADTGEHLACDGETGD